jgi:hypothetical protein
MVSYRDLIRIVFETLGLARVAKRIPGQEILYILDLLELGNIWEIIGQRQGRRVWRKTIFPLFLASAAVFA